ncbi:MAG TPA: bifunctional diguanylate cyclase/phosphodiesterase [Ilumatobacteraceae bacterium]|nr:bifunctional diguanylate cyclase/phosphodiesterase [Ilumatobacteraceae bacterium]
MADRSVNRNSTNRVVDLYVGVVALVAFGLTASVYVLQGGDVIVSSQIGHVAVFCGLLVIGETRTNWFRFGDGGEVTPGWAFAFSIVLLGAPIVAIAAIAACTMYVDLRDHKSVTKIVFNAAQITASLAAGALLLQLLGLRSPITNVERLTYRGGLGIVFAGALVFIANGLMTCIVLALHYKTTVRSMMGRSFFLSVSADGALLALSPIFVAAISYSMLMLPLLGVTAWMIYQSTQQALKRAHEATHDSLTRLLNRQTFNNHLSGFLASSLDDDVRGVVLLLDLDGFKEINDRLGHQTGDLVLQGFADRLRLAAPDTAVISRLGGDEFVLLIPDVDSEESTTKMVEQLRIELSRPIVVDSFPLSVGLSIGLAFIPVHGRTAEDLLSAADVAMYRAKRYRTGVESYKALGSRPERGRLGLLGELASALTQDQLKIHYQPLTRFRDGAPDSVEALLRWEHPTLGDVPPGDFITLAEHTDLIQPLTQLVLTQATRDARLVERFDTRMAINVSARNLQDRRFPATVLKALDDAALNPSRLELEITESALASEPERSLFAISALREAGVRVAIDDFGTGYSSFGMLRELTFDRLKIDASFVDGIANNQRQQHLVGAIVALAKRLGIETVVEGVETEEAWVTLRDLGCDIAQGFLVCRPLPLEDLVEWLDIRQSMSVLEHLSSADRGFKLQGRGTPSV